MKQWFGYAFIILTMMLSGTSVAPVALAAPGDVLEQGGCMNDTALCGDDGSDIFNVIQSIIQIMFIVAGVVAVIMIIIGGIAYTTSVGDPAKTKKAKDTVLYSVVGLVVSIMAYAIVTFVVGKF